MWMTNSVLRKVRNGSLQKNSLLINWLIVGPLVKMLPILKLLDPEENWYTSQVQEATHVHPLIDRVRARQLQSS